MATTTSRSRPWKNALLFAGVVVAMFLASLAVTAKLRYRGWPLLAYLTHHLLEPGGEYQSLRRFREVDDAAPVDIVFFGSSHAYRGFDPRVFAEVGYRSYNLGSTNQTPLNSYYLAERYLPVLRPRLVIFEVYYATLKGDGFEASRDLVVNTPWSWEMQKMAFATRQLGAVDYTLAKGLGLIGDQRHAVQRTIAGERYVPGGFCETTAKRHALERRRPFTVELLPRQLGYLADATRYARSAGARVVWVTHPLPRDHRQALDNYDEVHARIARNAAQSDVTYWNFDGQLGLDPLAHFADFHHLDAAGVRIFNRALIAKLKEHSYLE